MLCQLVDVATEPKHRGLQPRSFDPAIASLIKERPLLASCGAGRDIRFWRLADIARRRSGYGRKQSVRCRAASCEIGRKEFM